MTGSPDTRRLEVLPDAEGIRVRLTGDWVLSEEIPSVDPLAGKLSEGAPARITYDTADLGAWDSALLVFLQRVTSLAEARGIEEDRAGLPEGVRGMLSLAEAVPEKDARGDAGGKSFVTQVGLTTIEVTRGLGDMVRFLGEVTLSVGRLLTGRASFRRADMWLAVQQAGIEAVAIVALVSFLLGVILAFVGAIQLQQFGATIYVANLVGIAMVRDMGALMTGIVMSGRSGAAYAAEIGSMQVNEEVDALVTSGISPIDFLVLPRVFALVSMMPLLTIFSDFVSILGGMVIAVLMLDQSFTQYALQTTGAVSLSHVLGGLLKGTTYGLIVAMAGCLRGLQSGRSSLAVGAAATSAVVTSIVLIIAAAGFYAVLFYLLGI